MPIVFESQSKLKEEEKLDSNSIPYKLKQKLSGLGISITSIEEPISGPIVTGYPIKLSASTPINKILNKTEDLALACGVESVDIRRVGSEIVVYVPNKEKQIVKFMDALYWYIQDEEVKSMELPLLLGTNVCGENAVIELTKQPHILISGSTGSGKSIFEANIIASLAMLKSTNELEIYLVDTKMLDLPLFSSVPHVQDTAKTVEDFYSLIQLLNGQVEVRNRKLSNAGCRNIKEFNQQFPNKKLPYIVLIIDELADLIEKDKSFRVDAGRSHAEPKVLDSIRRLAQICRAAGIHIIACTQRTSGDIVSGVTKVNFPCRIALKLPTKRDSEYILDEAGAENLLGNGDMLIKESDSDGLKRFHSPFVRLEDIKNVISQLNFIKQSLGMEI